MVLIFFLLKVSRLRTSLKKGVTPDRVGAGYVLRRLIRRAILRALDLGIAQNFLAEIIPIIAENYKTLPDDILTNRTDALTILEKEVIKEIVYEKVYINQTPKEKYENIQSNKESKPQVSLNDNNTNVHTDASYDSISFVLYNKNLSFDRDTDLGTIISSICASFSASENISLDYTQLNPSVPGSYNVFLYSASGKTECITVNIN